MRNKWLRLSWYKHQIRSTFRAYLSKLWIKFKYRRVRINLNYDEFAWLVHDLEDLKESKGHLRCKRFFDIAIIKGARHYNE